MSLSGLVGLTEGAAEGIRQMFIGDRVDVRIPATSQFGIANGGEKSVCVVLGPLTPDTYDAKYHHWRDIAPRSRTVLAWRTQVRRLEGDLTPFDAWVTSDTPKYLRETTLRTCLPYVESDSSDIPSDPGGWDGPDGVLGQKFQVELEPGNSLGKLYGIVVAHQVDLGHAVVKIGGRQWKQEQGVWFYDRPNVLRLASTTGEFYPRVYLGLPA